MDLGRHFLGPRKWASEDAEVTGIFLTSFTQMPPTGSQQLTSSSCISQHDAVGAFSSGFF